MTVRMIWPVVANDGEESVMFLVDQKGIGRRWLRAHGEDAKFLRWIVRSMNELAQAGQDPWLAVTAKVGDEIAVDVLPDMSADFPLVEEAVAWHVMEV